MRIDVDECGDDWVLILFICFYNKLGGFLILSVDSWYIDNN